jgi:hypothetical protein
MEHERHIFEQHPRNVVLLEKLEHMGHEGGLLALQASRPPRLAKVLARESRRHEIDCPVETYMFSNVGMNWRSRETLFQNRHGRLIDLAQRRSPMAGQMQTPFDASDAREEAGYGE